MRKTFLTNLLFAVTINLLVKPLYLFGVEVGVQNTLGVEVYGLYFALLNSAFLLQIINDFGIQIFNNRQIAIDRSQLSSLIPGFVVLKLILSGVYVILLAILAYILDLTHFLHLLLLVGLNMILTSFVLFVRSGISGLGYYRIDSALSVLDKFLMLFIIGGLLIFSGKGKFTIYHFVLGQMAALGLTLVFSWFLLKRYSPFPLFGFSFKPLKGLLIKAMPYALAVFLMTLYTRIDGVMILKLLSGGEHEAGIYAAGYRILDAVNMFAFLFAVLLLPMFSSAQSSIPQLRNLLDEGFRYMWLLVVPACTFGILHREEIMMTLYTQADVYWGDVFALLIANFILMGMMYVFGTFLTAMGHIRSMNFIFAFTVSLNVFLNFLLIPHYKALGAAVTTLITQFFAVCGIVYLCIRVLPLIWSSAYLFRILGFSMYCIVTGILLSSFGSLVGGLCLYILSTILGGILFRILRWRELTAIYRAHDQT